MGTLPKIVKSRIPKFTQYPAFLQVLFSFRFLKQSFIFHLSTFTQSQKKKRNLQNLDCLLIVIYSTVCLDLLLTTSSSPRFRYLFDTKFVSCHIYDICIMSSFLAWPSISICLSHLCTDDCMLVCSEGNWMVNCSQPQGFLCI